MKLHLRFGMHRDVQLMHEEKDKYDGFVIPGHILAHQSASTSVFVTSLFDRPYVIDPMTFILQNPKKAHYSENGNVRPSVEKILNAYHPTLVARIATLDTDGVLPPTQYPELGELCSNCYIFQTEMVAAEVKDSAAAKYLKRYKQTQTSQPRSVIPPYFMFYNTSTDRFYDMSVRCAELFRLFEQPLPVAPVILCPASALTDQGIATIVRDFESFSRVLLWIDGFAQGQASVSNIVKVRRLVNALSSAGVAVEALYGGYLMALLRFDGLEAISHGILYTQHKSYTLTPGSGGAPERYYIPGIWEFRSMSQTDIILHKHPELMCDCSVCSEVLAGNPDNIVKFVDNPDLLRKHFLTVRRRELNEIEVSRPDQEATRFRDAHRKYHGSFSTLPNPDAMVVDATIQGLDYLLNWAEAITA